MGSPDASEFQTLGPGYSPDRFYTQSKYGPNGERRWVSLGKHTMPAELVARVEDLVHSRSYPAYRSFSDFLRDAIVHHLHRRLTELEDPFWAGRRDALLALFEVERLEIEAATGQELTERWRRLLDEERDPQRRMRLVEKARDDIEALGTETLRTELTRIIDSYDR